MEADCGGHIRPEEGRAGLPIGLSAAGDPPAGVTAVTATVDRAGTEPPHGTYGPWHGAHYALYGHGAYSVMHVHVHMLQCMCMSICYSGCACAYTRPVGSNMCVIDMQALARLALTTCRMEEWELWLRVSTIQSRQFSGHI